MKVHFNVRYLGIMLIVIGAATTLTAYSLSASMLKLVDEVGLGSCGSVGTCPHVTVINHSYVFYTISLLILVAGILLLLFEEKPKTETRKKDWDEEQKKLEGDEKTIYGIIKSSEGIIFQSQLVKKSGLTKVKVSRVLDNMEAKGLLERRRRGMSNSVVLK